MLARTSAKSRKTSCPRGSRGHEVMRESFRALWFAWLPRRLHLPGPEQVMHVIEHVPFSMFLFAPAPGGGILFKAASARCGYRSNHGHRSQVSARVRG